MTAYADFASASEVLENAKRVHRAMWKHNKVSVVKLPSSKKDGDVKPEIKSRQMAEALEMIRREQEQDRAYPLQKIVAACAKAGMISPNDIKSSRRGKAIMPYRFAVYYLGRKFTKASYPVIGRAVGNRDHSSVMHGIRVVTAALERGDYFYSKVIALALDNLEGA